MNGIRKRLEQDLRMAVSRLRQVGGAAALDDLLGPSGEHWAYADEVDEIQANERREIGFATRELLVGEVNRSWRRSTAGPRRVRSVRGVRGGDRAGASQRDPRGRRPACAARTAWSARAGTCRLPRSRSASRDD